MNLLETQHHNTVAVTEQLKMTKKYINKNGETGSKMAATITK